ncbi:tetratricopeptide repeat protein [Shewanella aestuarii]|uniref:Tetratricopeptide repeat protein n=1 Tax=Shewanella aestuarii TaxID=1028752 RepID=A0A6G9QKJ6_9GAMM|nr:tetratricopeptide repeat protein [Shewanella aestuarii]QIR15094.1 tetratricopeptide repeat protein [Shewanella aestuarii]
MLNILLKVLGYILFTASLLFNYFAYAQAPHHDLLSKLNTHETKGAASGFVDDIACSTCHNQIYQSYQNVGMARSFSSPANTAFIERFGEEFYQTESQRYYRIDQQGTELTFFRYQKDSDGKIINQISLNIEWVLGSGYRARSYLYRNDSGELFMLPIGWYSQSQEWGMSPGFEDAEHFGIQRQIKRECLFCHNAYPEVPINSDHHLAGHYFPKELPQGTGCQRCHGPGAEHVRTALSVASKAEIIAKIINPRKLPPEERDSICFQCHMLPAVSMIGIRDFNQSTYSFRAGQKLTNYINHVEVTQENVEKDEQFEINHHGYRFWQSKCYQQSEAELACITCHNPHEKPNSAQFRASVSNKCQNCHSQIVTLHPNLSSTTQMNEANKGTKSDVEPITADSDCVTCHMPTRRTQDVIKVTMTDHLISRGPFDLDAILKPRERDDPIITDVNLLPWGELPNERDTELLRAVTVLRTRANKDATNALKNLLINNPIRSPIPYIDLLNAEITLGKYGDAENTAHHVLNQPNAPTFEVLSQLALAQLGLNKTQSAIDTLTYAISLRNNPVNNYNLGVILFNQGQFEQAEIQFDLAIKLRPNMHAAWLYRGRILAQNAQFDEAIEAMKQSLAIAPSYENAYVDLINLLEQQQHHDEARRYLEVGLRVASSTGQLTALESKR